MNSHPNQNLTTSGVSDLNASALEFNKLGLSVDDIVNDLNTFTAWAQQENDTDIIQSGQLFEKMSVISFLLGVRSCLVSPLFIS